MALAASMGFSALAGGAPPSRPDQSGSLQLFGGGSGTLVSSTQIPVRIRGALAVQFHGDQATGCAARGLCGFSGTVIWQPPSAGTLQTDTFRDHGNTEYDATLELFGGASSPIGPPADGGVTTADVRFAPPGSAGSSSLCTDATATGASISMPVQLRAASISLAAATPSLLGTRCAGPLESDVARLLARRIIDVAALLNGRTSVSLASSGEFAVDGLAGTVTSTVQLSLGRPHTQRVPNSSGVSGFRSVEIDYRAHLDGSLVVHTHGDPLSCAGLGSCGSNGEVALHLHSGTQALQFVVVTRARRPLRDALTALGLRHDGNPRGIPVFGAFLEDGPATSTVRFTQGGATCKDTGPGGPAEVLLAGSRGRLSAGFAAALPALHLRCPGPLFSEGTGLAAGTTRIRLLGRRSGTIRLRSGVKVDEPGYTGRTVADLVLTFSHPKVKLSRG